MEREGQLEEWAEQRPEHCGNINSRKMFERHIETAGASMGQNEHSVIPKTLQTLNFI